MKVLVINSGSSSLKYQLINMENEELISKGNYEKIGQEGSFITHKMGSEKYVTNRNAKTHKEALDFIIKELQNEKYKSIDSLEEITAIGHRMVHGGEFGDSAVVTEEIKKIIEENADLAPLHNPVGLIGIKACEELMPNKKNVVVFDTAFHQTISAEKYIYPIPYKYYEKYKIRKYGFHGTSHYFVSRRIAELLNKPANELKIVNCHLGQGASICAIKNGESVETSMGMTPVSGIPMCTRSGDLDPSVVTYLMKKENLSPDQMENLLNNESGLYGISNTSKDFREIESAAYDQKNKGALLAVNHYMYKIAEHIAKYVIALGGLDVITFTGGVGENQKRIRKGIISYLDFFGAKLDEKRNETRDEARISSDDSNVEIWVVPTNEELVIARETISKLNI